MQSRVKWYMYICIKLEIIRNLKGISQFFRKMKSDSTGGILPFTFRFSANDCGWSREDAKVLFIK